jgi:hypothetical protein
MNATAILGLIASAVAVLPNLVDAGINIYDRVQKIQALAKAAADGTVTDADIQAVRGQLDADLSEFNSPMPPAA